MFKAQQHTKNLVHSLISVFELFLNLKCILARLYIQFDYHPNSKNEFDRGGENALSPHPIYFSLYCDKFHENCMQDTATVMKCIWLNLIFETNSSDENRVTNHITPWRNHQKR